MLQVELPKNCAEFLRGVRDFSIRHSFESSNGVHPASRPNDVMMLTQQDKAAEA
jgi:hypothetical protein